MKIIRANWKLFRHKLVYLRKTVFIEEQGVPLADEWDGKDQHAMHYVLLLDNRVTGCARIIINKQTAKIGRVAIRKEFRYRHLGTRLMLEIMKELFQKNLQAIELDAQTYIIPWYQELGFQVSSQCFMDAGIPHKTMRMTKNMYFGQR